MNAAKCLVLIMAAVGLCGCASPANDAKKEIVSVKLNATPRNAGEIAWATLAPLGDETDISLRVGGVPFYVIRPVHLYTFIYPGTCANPGASPAYELNRTITTYRLVQGDVWRLSKSAPVPLSTLRSGDYSIVLRTAPADGGYDIFCGDIR
ncbi:hypothetical protein [Metapseudomonas boanensis]|uniref:Lipoprotein n=1 Tax=Metapseudomonas boanensis TaxID=2822138 RepID=A0ABS5XGF6_9GAMM|nr:hypothetical protein [Pseudomonas boanensis]MBT8766755.1 hypothetical protein [Pseudomonas boanensis]